MNRNAQKWGNDHKVSITVLGNPVVNNIYFIDSIFISDVMPYSLLGSGMKNSLSHLIVCHFFAVFKVQACFYSMWYLVIFIYRTWGPGYQSS